MIHTFLFRMATGIGVQSCIQHVSSHFTEDGRLYLWTGFICAGVSGGFALNAIQSRIGGVGWRRWASSLGFWRHLLGLVKKLMTNRLCALSTTLPLNTFGLLQFALPNVHSTTQARAENTQFMRLRDVTERLLALKLLRGRQSRDLSMRLPFHDS